MSQVNVVRAAITVEIAGKQVKVDAHLFEAVSKAKYAEIDGEVHAVFFTSPNLISRRLEDYLAGIDSRYKRATQIEPGDDFTRANLLIEDKDKG